MHASILYQERSDRSGDSHPARRGQGLSCRPIDSLHTAHFTGLPCNSHVTLPPTRACPTPACLGSDMMQLPTVKTYLLPLRTPSQHGSNTPTFFAHMCLLQTPLNMFPFHQHFPQTLLLHLRCHLWLDLSHMSQAYQALQVFLLLTSLLQPESRCRSPFH